MLHVLIHFLPATLLASQAESGDRVLVEVAVIGTRAWAVQRLGHHGVEATLCHLSLTNPDIFIQDWVVPSTAIAPEAIG